MNGLMYIFLLPQLSNILASNEIAFPNSQNTETADSKINIYNTKSSKLTENTDLENVIDFLLNDTLTDKLIEHSIQKRGRRLMKGIAQRYARFRSDLGKRGVSFEENIGKDSISEPNHKRYLPLEFGIKHQFQQEQKRLFRGDLGKRNHLYDDDQNFLNQDQRDEYSPEEEKRFFRMDLGKRSDDSNIDKRLFRTDLGKRSDFDSDYITQEEKRLFRADLGKRDFISNDSPDYMINEKRMFRGDLGKRDGEEELENEKRAFRMDLGKRSLYDLNDYYDLEKKYSSFRMDLGKRYSGYSGFRTDLGKRNSYNTDIGKQYLSQSDIANPHFGSHSDLEKRSTDNANESQKAKRFIAFRGYRSANTNWPHLAKQLLYKNSIGGKRAKSFRWDLGKRSSNQSKTS